MVDGSQPGNISHKDVFIDLMDGCVHRAQFDDLGAGSGNKSSVRGAAAGRQCRPMPRHRLYALGGRIDQGPRLGQEWLPADLPLDMKIPGVFADDLLTALADGCLAGFRGEAHIELGG